ALLVEAFGIEAGDAPHVDLDAERANGSFVLANRALIRAATDLGDGGLGLAAFELAFDAGAGVTLSAGDIPTLFGEDQARYLIATDKADDLIAAAEAAGVPAAIVGRIGGDTLTFGADSAAMADLSAIFTTAFEKAVA